LKHLSIWQRRTRCACAQHPAEVCARHANPLRQQRMVFREKTLDPWDSALDGARLWVSPELIIVPGLPVWGPVAKEIHNCL